MKYLFLNDSFIAFDTFNFVTSSTSIAIGSILVLKGFLYHRTRNNVSLIRFLRIGTPVYKQCHSTIACWYTRVPTGDFTTVNKNAYIGLTFDKFDG